MRRLKLFFIAVILVVSNLNLIYYPTYASADGMKPTIESMSVDKGEVTAGDTVKIRVKIKEYQDFGYLIIYYSSPITGKSITIGLNLNSETNVFEGNIPISDYVESGDYTPYMLSLYNSSVTTIYNSEYDGFENGKFLVSGTSGKDLIENISVNKKEATAGDIVKVSLKTTNHEGIDYMNSYFSSPITNQTLSVSLNYNPESNAFEGNIPISSISESGTYKLFMLNTYESGNSTTFYRSNYAEKFQEADFTVSGTNVADIIESISVDKNKLTVGDTIKFTVKSQELPDIRYFNIYFSSPITGKSFSIDLFYNSETKSFEGSYLVPNDLELGTYNLFMMGIYDTYGNTSSLYASNYPEFESGNFSFFKEDNPPTFSNVTIDQNQVKPGDQVRISVAAADDTILQDAIITYISPQSKNKYSVPLSYDRVTNGFSGVFSTDDKSEIGMWKVDSIEIRDTNQNLALIKADSFDLSNGDFSVNDVIAPSIPTINEVTDKSTNITGLAEANSTITAKTGNIVLGTATVDANGIYSLNIPKQKAGTKISVISTDAAGNSSESNEIIVIDVTPPESPVVYEVSDQDRKVTGETEAGSNVEVKVDDILIGSSTAEIDNRFSVEIPMQKAGKELVIQATDYAGNVSETIKVLVKDATAPLKPVVHEVTDKDTFVTGEAESGSKIEVKVNSLVLGTETVGEDGKYKVAIPVLKTGTELVIIATDLAGNVSEPTKVVVKDVTSPEKPIVNEVTDKDTTVTGKAEAGSKVEVRVNESVIGTGTAGEDGQFNIAIQSQQAGIVLNITATDNAGNMSHSTTIIVKDGTAPLAPIVENVSDISRMVWGKAEVGSLVTVTIGQSQYTTIAEYPFGYYEVTIPAQKEGTVIEVTATDSAGNVSDARKVTVLDGTPPTVPIVNEFNDQSSEVSGTTEAGAKVYVVYTSPQYGVLVNTGYADENGHYRVEIPVQTAGSTITVLAVDAMGNQSEPTKIIVQDATAPAAPQINEVTDKSQEVSGTTEAGAKVTVSIGSIEYGLTEYTGKADENGHFNVSIPTQHAGTEITVFATDESGNVSGSNKVIVKDVTAPEKPEANEITDKDNLVTGLAEAGSKVQILVEGSVISTGTAGVDGTFIINIPVQKAGTELKIISTDNAGNVSETTTVVVKDITTPTKPLVNEVTDQDTSVTGEAESGTKIEVRINGSLLQTGTVGEDGQYKVTIPVQKAGTELVISATDMAGNVSETTKIVVKDVTAPVKPEVNNVTDKDTTVTGQAEVGSKVEVKVNDSVIGTGIVGEDGQYKVTIPVQKAGTELVISATDKTGNLSETTTVVVKDVTAPAKPEANEVTDKDTSVTGQAEAGSRLEVKVNGSVIGTGTAGEDGQYRVTIPAQKAGTELVISATDKNGNVSETTTVVVKDVTAPAKPVINKLSDKDTTVTGKAEAGATIEVKVNGSVIATVTAGKDGQFKVSIRAQKAGTVIAIIATDSAGNQSEETTIKVLDKIAPTVLTVNTVTDKYKEVTGKTEAGATVSILIGTKIYVAKADTKGNFKVIIPAQKAGTKIIVTAKDTAGNVSAAKSITVLDKTAPVTPTVLTVSSLAKVVIGKAEAGSIVTVAIGTKKYIAKADVKGNYKLTIPAQKAGTKVVVTAKDAAGNVSVARSVIVIDKTGPSTPKIKTTMKSTTKEVTGTAEAYSTITIKVGKKVIGTAKVDSKGKFKVKIKAQKKKSVLSVTATDKAKNVSKAATVKVK